MHDTSGLLVRVSNLMQSLNVSLVKMNAEKTPQNVAVFDLTVELSNAEQLVTLIHQLKKMPECIQVYRKNG